MEIRFVGGPADGRTLAIPDASPPPLYLIPLVPSISEIMSLDPSPTRVAEYEPQVEGGLFRVADDGVYLYRHRVKPPTPEERQRAEDARRAAREAEARREAEADAAWREIRRERPDYPEDWRDLR
ncbi:hypothetical protein [Streptomyces sp. NPDC003832]